MQIQKPADLARLVKTRRQAQGLTQQNVADSVGITRQSLARIERGHGGASFDTVLRTFEALGIRLEATSNGQRQINTSPPPSRWPATLNDLAGEVGETVARTAPELSARAARQALLNAAIEAGDPDRKDSTTAGEVQLRDTPDGADHG